MSKIVPGTRQKRLCIYLKLRTEIAKNRLLPFFEVLYQIHKYIMKWFSFRSDEFFQYRRLSARRASSISRVAAVYFKIAIINFGKLHACHIQFLPPFWTSFIPSKYKLPTPVFSFLCWVCTMLSVLLCQLKMERKGLLD